MNAFVACATSAGIQLAHGAVPVARLAEAAALRAAAHDLEAEAVLDDVDGRDHRLCRVDVGRELLDPDALDLRGNARRVRGVRDDAVAVVTSRRRATARRSRGRPRTRGGARGAGGPSSAATASRKTGSASSASPIRKTSKKSARGSGFATHGPPPMTIGSASVRSAARTGIPARSSMFGTFV